MNLDGLNAEGEVALSFAWLVARDPQWRTVNWRRLSLTDVEWGPGQQLYGTLTACFSRLEIRPGNPAGLGFAARTHPDGSIDVLDARRKEKQWRILLTPDGIDPDDPSPASAERPAS